jgi:hypothetical protein
LARSDGGWTEKGQNPGDEPGFFFCKYGIRGAVPGTGSTGRFEADESNKSIKKAKEGELNRFSLTAFLVI